MVKIIQSMYRNARSRVRVRVTFSDDSLVQVKLYQGSVLWHLFIIVWEAYANDLPIVSEILESLTERLEFWKRALSVVNKC